MNVNYLQKLFAQYYNNLYFCTTLNNKVNHNNNGSLAQLVEQWIENPCVPGSIPGGTTRNKISVTNPSNLQV